MAMNVNELIAALTEIAEAGLGEALVITEGRRDVREPTVRDFDPIYIGGSPWDSAEYSQNQMLPGHHITI